MATKRFKTRSVEIEATQFTGDNWDEMKQWTEGNFRQVETVFVGERLVTAKGTDSEILGQVYDKLHRTWIGVAPGQWIVRGVKGEFYPCDDETFHWKYEEVSAPQKADMCDYPIGSHSRDCRSEGGPCYHG